MDICVAWAVPTEKSIDLPAIPAPVFLLKPMLLVPYAVLGNASASDDPWIEVRTFVLNTSELGAFT